MAKADLVIKAKALGINDPESLTVVNLEAAIKTVVFELKTAASKASEEFNQLDPGAAEEQRLEAKNAMDAAIAAYAPYKPENKDPKIDTDVFTSEKGRQYVFAKDTPPAFRYFGEIRSQKEWLADKDAMELMIAGHNPYVEHLKN